MLANRESIDVTREHVLAPSDTAKCPEPVAWFEKTPASAARSALITVLAAPVSTSGGSRTAENTSSSTCDTLRSHMTMTPMTQDARERSRQPTPCHMNIVLGLVLASLACGSVTQNPSDDASGSCTADDLRCEANRPQRCVSGQWQDQAACIVPRNACSAGTCVTRSCADGKMCSGIGCCDSFFLTGFNYPMGRSTSGSDAFTNGKAAEIPEHTVTVGSFYLDALEISVGRFRAFVEAYDMTPRPVEGAGAHPRVPASGWQAGWSQLLPATAAELRARLACGATATWTDAPGANERKPINCLTWYELHAFCIWDGGRLPTEAEWEFAAAGGLANRLYPWGSQAPTPQLATFNCTTATCGIADIRDVGSAPQGATPSNGIRDLAGSMWEWTRDRYSDVWYSNGGNVCDNCINLTMPTSQGYTIRGGGWDAVGDDLRVVRRDTVIPDYRGTQSGLSTRFSGWIQVGVAQGQGGFLSNRA